MPTIPGLRAILVALLVSSAALFAIGVAVERSQPAHSAARETAERRAATTTTTGGETPAERSGETATPTPAPAHARTPATPAEHSASETGGGTAETHHSATESAAGTEGHITTTETHRERVFGINVEATPLVVGAVVGSLLLAAAVWRFPRTRVLLVATAAVCLLAAAFDAREAVLQSREARTGLMLTAAVVAALHLAAAATAGGMARRAT
ncbi:MAG: hypothetical protein U0Y82_12620 [Thermoleophilia bacterium]